MNIKNKIRLLTKYFFREPGPPGDDANVGESLTKRPKGSQGLPGEDGRDGPKGEQGRPGLFGAPGFKGDRGYFEFYITFHEYVAQFFSNVLPFVRIIQT